MEGRRHERRHHFRGKSHPDRVMSVRFRPAGVDAWIATKTRNVGVGGAFLEAPTDGTGTCPPVGTTISLELTLPTSDQAFALPAVVRWAAAEGGVGVQFVDVDVDVLLELNDYFSSLTP
ncbi:MAG: PilZ domain-containing protein [Kofleriaceae bacterium]